MSDAQDLGVMDGPMLVFGGPYSNLQATEALLARAAALGIPASRILCSGDVVAYCADPQATADLVRESGIAVVMGNCEESVGTDSADCGCGFEEGSSCDLLSAQWYAYSVASLDRNAKAWMRGLPRRITFEMAGRRLLAIHGGVGAINRFIFPSTPQAEKADELDRAGTDGVIGGHSGIPFTQIVSGRLWHNAGVIGMPANDGTPRGWYSLLQPTDDGILVEHCELAYDHDRAASRMREAGLPPPYADALESGLWPSDDFMPEEDRRNRDRPLRPNRVVWRGREAAQPVSRSPASPV